MDMTTHKAHPPIYYTVRTIVRSVFIITVTLLAFLFGKAVASDPYGYKCDGAVVMVSEGDSLWSIASEHCTGHIGQAVDDLVNVHGETVRYGDYITLNGERK